MKTTSITKADLEDMKNIDLKNIDSGSLVDIRDIHINMELSKEERIFDYIRQIKNPYVCKCGDIIIQSIFADTDFTLTERLKQYLKIV